MKERISLDQAQDFIDRHFAAKADDLALIGEGGWSRCFGFRVGADNFAVRFGQHVIDFQKDKFASKFTAASLPIPKVFEIGQALDGYFAISSRAYGVPLESVNSADWRALVPSVVSMLEAMRMADLSRIADFGGWDETGRASNASWSEHLLAVGEDAPDARIHGWKQRLIENSPEGALALERGYSALKSVVSDAIPRSLVHCDLVNRNVLANDGRITAVFDWGCARYGDHLYDLAWFEFWAPWLPQLDISTLRESLEARWQSTGYTPTEKETRLTACYLHIGLDHIAYNAHLGDWLALNDVVKRMRDLAPGL